jgi:Arylsulfotransferase (ASST)
VAGVLALALGPGVGGSAASASASPSCLPADLDASARLPGTPLLVSPMPGSADATPTNQISFLGAPASALGDLTVSGSSSGVHDGRLEPYSQDDGASFVPAQPFSPGERVTVAGGYLAAGATVPFSYSFTVGAPDPIAELPESGRTSGPAGTILHFHSAPQLTPPRIRIFHSAPASRAGGDIFLSVYPGPGQTGPEIMAPDGQLVWFLPLATGTFATNVLVQRYLGKPVLTWWQGTISHHGFGFGEGEIYDEHYRPLASVAAGNGIAEDLHELQLTPQGTALITAWKPLYCDLSSVGGPDDVALYDPVMQEIDVKTGLVMYEWDSLDHVPLRDSHIPVSKASVAWPWDWFHMNSLQLLGDGSWLISSRNTWAIYDVDSHTGRIRWQLGGRQSSFAMGPGTRFSWQHDARRLGADLLTLFDNSGPPSHHPQSKGLVIRIDMRRRRARLVHVARPPGRLWAQTQGDLQLLPDGDWWLEWGDTGEISESSPSGRLLYVAHSPGDTQIYRALRFRWRGEPLTAPALALARGGHRSWLYASWNGATGVARWRVLGGSTPGALTAVSTRRASGFETRLPLPRGAAYGAVQALAANGHTLASSATISLASAPAARRAH